MAISSIEFKLFDPYVMAELGDCQILGDDAFRLAQFELVRLMTIIGVPLNWTKNLMGINIKDLVRV